MIVIFACRPARLRDIVLIRRGALAAGHRLLVMQLPFALPLIVAAGLLRVFGIRMHLVLSDKFPGDQWLARLFGTRSTRMLWNYADEWSARGTRLPSHKVCFFSEPGQNADTYTFAPQPQSRRSAAVARPVVFIGDVNIACSVSQGAAWWRQRFEGLREKYGYDFYLEAEYQSLIAAELPEAADRRAVRVLAKNLVRLWVVQDARREFGERIVLVGDNWRRFSLASDPSIYAVDARLEYFRSATVNLDCASKSGDSALYPRSSELISFAGGLLQLRCADDTRVFGERASEFCFCDPAGLLTRIAQRLRESRAARDERDEWLIDRLRAQRLLMQHSIDRMLVR